MKLSIPLRMWLNLGVFISVLFLPWWISTLLILILLFVARAYEVLLWGLLIDILYGTPLPAFFDMVFLFTVLFLILFLAVEYIKRYLVFYPT